MKRCPFCAEEIQDAAIVCRYCSHDLPSAPLATPAVASAAGATTSVNTRAKGSGRGAERGENCSLCGNAMIEGAVSCGHCGAFRVYEPGLLQKGLGLVGLCGIAVALMVYSDRTMAAAMGREWLGMFTVSLAIGVFGVYRFIFGKPKLMYKRIFGVTSR